jgi:hypothetical protein
MKRSLLSILVITAAVVSPAAGGAIDMHTTESGGDTLTGGRGQESSYGLTQMLMDQDNALEGQALTERTGTVDGSAGLEADNMDTPVGVILSGPGNTKLTYDRLAYKPVLQVLGYDTLDSQASNPPVGSAGPFDDGLHPSSEGITGNSGAAPTGQVLTLPQGEPVVVVPEPAGGLMLAVGLLVMGGTRTKRISRIH